MKLKPPLDNDAIEPSPAALPTQPHTVRDPHAAVSFKKILVPVDFSVASVHALEYALELSEQFHARLVLLHVVEPAVHPDNYLLAPVLDETNSRLLDAAREHLLAFGRKRVGHRVPCETLVRVGHPVSEIPDTAKALAADLIVVGARALRPHTAAGVGSTAQRVVHHAPCPVLIVPLPVAAPAQ